MRTSRDISSGGVARAELPGVVSAPSLWWTSPRANVLTRPPAEPQKQSRRISGDGGTQLGHLALVISSPIAAEASEREPHVSVPVVLWLSVYVPEFFGHALRTRDDE